MDNGLFNSVYNPDVLSCIANLSSDEVFTPPEIANKMLDLLPQELFENPDTTFLDPACKSGVFLREIAKRLIEGLEPQIPNLEKRIEHIFSKQLFGISITELTSLLSRRSVYCSKYPSSKFSVYQFPEKQSQGNILFQKIKHTWENGRCKYCGAAQSEYDRENILETHAYQFIHISRPEDIFKMKFDVIIGNPPYHLSDGGGTGSSAIPIYNLFVQQAKKLNPRFISMIIPSRWFTGGKGLDSFRSEMLNDNRLRVIHDFANAADCFSGVSIEGGVCYFLWDRDNGGLCKIISHSGENITSESERPLLEEGADVFIRYNEMISIIRKVASFKEKSFSEIVSSRNPYGINSYLFSSEETKNGISVLGIEGGKRIYKKLHNSLVVKNKDEINKYRIYISKADGAAGQIGYPIPARIIGKSEISMENSACTETFLRIGPFKNLAQAKNAKSFLETKFVRALIGARKNKNMTQSTYSFVPLVDFSYQWNDEKLYQRYGLNNEEIEFINKMIADL